MVAHPQANGQIEVINRTILHGLKAWVKNMGGSWVDELHSILWAYCTMPHLPTGESPYMLVYRAEAILLEIGLHNLRVEKFDPTSN